MNKNKKTNLTFLNKTTLAIVGILLMIVLAGIFLWQSNKNSNQSIPATPAQVYFVGQYRIADGDWKDIVKGEHISSTQGKVTLRGNFYMAKPNGEELGIFKGGSPIAFYTNHINLTFYELDRQPYSIDNENPRIGKSACGKNWVAYYFSNPKEPIEIVIHNPHKYGNENAIDEMLNGIAFWADIEFEKGILADGAAQRNTGLVFIISALMFLSTALFSSLIHLKNSKIIWLLGLVSLFAGLYFTYSSTGISFWSESVVANTIILGVSMTFYSFFIATLITYSLKRTKKIGVVVCLLLGLINSSIVVLSMATKAFYYDTWFYWMIAQNIANIVLFACLIKEFICATIKEKFLYISAVLPLIAFGVDSIAVWLGAWQNGLASELVFIMLFVVAMIVVLRIIPQSINAISKSKELEREKLILNTQLAESRVSTMMSQIRPHFIYNTLGSIEQLCELDPQKAGELVHNFAKYLRGNFGELDNPKPILMSQEMEHVHHYISIENVRFPDMTFTFEMNSNDFHIPALTIQPIVENAIKHGLMKLQKGGTIHVVSYETDSDYCVLVEDDGVGFDTSVLLDERKHLGIRNIRGRLKAMVSGSLEIESVVGKGTKVLITIPKEVG